MTHGSFQPQAATLGLFLWSQTFLKNRCRKERELLLIWGPAPRPPGFFQGMGVYRPMRVKAGREAQLHAPFSSFDELTGLFLSAVASPQSRPPLHPLRSPYKPHDPAQVFFESDTTFLLLPSHSGTTVEWYLRTQAGPSGGNTEAGWRSAQARHSDRVGSIHPAGGDAGSTKAVGPDVFRSQLRFSTGSVGSSSCKIGRAHV